jgi:hypothetical protein
MRCIEQHLAEYVGPEHDALVFTASKGGPLFLSTFAGTCGIRPLPISAGGFGGRMPDVSPTASVSGQPFLRILAGGRPC